ncbi:DNA polymerase lambda isoform X2 [Ascaphus truei]|uniref:DNA polymerase lambda isoform X2 n=1 Tax=Ascaphus truei TaxID=8439 RepID=UPI003F59169F
MEPTGIVKAFPKVKRLREASVSAEDEKKIKTDVGVQEKWLGSVSAHILQAGIGRARSEILQKQIIQNGGHVVPHFSCQVTHIIVDEGMDCDRAFRLLKLKKLPPGVQLVKSSWLSLCIKEKELVNTAGYRIFIPDRYLDVKDEEQKEQRHESNEKYRKHDEVPQATDISHTACNSQIQHVSDSTKLNYDKTIKIQEACNIPGIGKKMAEKIEEILESGHLRKLDHISESVPVLEIFSNIWGAGTKTAQTWYQQGFRSLDDIRTKANLTNQQTIGLKYYDDFLDRMSREEAGRIEETVRDVAQGINPDLMTVACGSFRRRKQTCGDVDVLVTHPDGKSHKGIFSKLIDGLKMHRFLTDDLVSHEENGTQKKYMGVCCLQGPGQRHRRLDIIVVPYGEFACALMYFTGSAHFNRSMRALAKTKGMSLSEHSLNKDVVRNGNVKVGTGYPIATPTENDIFEILGLPFREPHERDW